MIFDLGLIIMAIGTVLYVKSENRLWAELSLLATSFTVGCLLLLWLLVALTVP